MVGTTFFFFFFLLNQTEGTKKPHVPVECLFSCIIVWYVQYVYRNATEHVFSLTKSDLSSSLPSAHIYTAVFTCSLTSLQTSNVVLYDYQTTVPVFLGPSISIYNGTTSNKNSHKFVCSMYRTYSLVVFCILRKIIAGMSDSLRGRAAAVSVGVFLSSRVARRRRFFSSRRSEDDSHWLDNKHAMF